MLCAAWPVRMGLTPSWMTKSRAQWKEFSILQWLHIVPGHALIIRRQVENAVARLRCGLPTFRPDHNQAAQVESSTPGPPDTDDLVGTCPNVPEGSVYGPVVVLTVSPTARHLTERFHRSVITELAAEGRQLCDTRFQCQPCDHRLNIMFVLDEPHQHLSPRVQGNPWIRASYGQRKGDYNYKLTTRGPRALCCKV